MEDAVEEMIYGFGFADKDSIEYFPPERQTVLLTTHLVQQYMRDLARRALEIAELRGVLDVGCYTWLVRKDQQKFSRVRRLLQANERVHSAIKRKHELPVDDIDTEDDRGNMTG
jgi:hypothetical protein